MKILKTRFARALIVWSVWAVLILVIVNYLLNGVLFQGSIQEYLLLMLLSFAAMLLSIAVSYSFVYIIAWVMAGEDHEDKLLVNRDDKK